MQDLYQVASVFSGYTFREALSHKEGGVIRVIQPRNQRNISDAGAIDTFPGYEKYLLQNDDVLIVIKGSVNTVTLLDLVDDHKYICTSAFAVIRPNASLIDPAYLTWYLQHEGSQRLLRANQTGTTVQNLSLKDLQNLPVALIPLLEQKAIGQLASLESKRLDLINQLSFKRKLLLDENLMDIVKEKGSNE